MENLGTICTNTTFDGNASLQHSAGGVTAQPKVNDDQAQVWSR